MTIRALAFGTPDGVLWGAALSGAGDASPALVIGSGATGAARADGLEWSSREDGRWLLDGAGVALEVAGGHAPVPPVTDGEPDPVLDSAAAQFVAGKSPELARVTGTIDGQTLNCAGTRLELPGSRSGRQAPAAARLVAGWLVDGAAFACVAVRPRSAGDHGSDAAYATLLDPTRWIRVADPRLSTTYDGAGVPTRTNLELWIGEEEHEYPRRVAGEVTGTGAMVDGTGGSGQHAPQLRVLPLRCHSRGEEGAGVYALATF